MDWLDISSWKRKQQFEFFSAMQAPHYNICANVDVSSTLNYCQHHQVSSFNAIAYLVTQTANQIENFRLRIRDGKVCRHSAIHPSVTFIKEEDVFGYFTAGYGQDFAAFNLNVENAMAQAADSENLNANVSRDDLIYLSCLPWVQFTSVSHAMSVPATDAIPRFTWGKYFDTVSATMMPLSVQVHHGLVDGVHIGQFFEQLQEKLNTPALLE